MSTANKDEQKTIPHKLLDRLSDLSTAENSTYYNENSHLVKKSFEKNATELEYANYVPVTKVPQSIRVPDGYNDSEGHIDSYKDYTTWVPYSPTYEPQQKSVRFSMPLAHTKKIRKSNMQLHSTYGTFNTANKKQYDDSTKLPATLHGLSTSSTKKNNPNIHHYSTPNCIPQKLPTREIFEKK